MLRCNVCNVVRSMWSVITDMSLFAFAHVSVTMETRVRNDTEEMGMLNGTDKQAGENVKR